MANEKSVNKMETKTTVPDLAKNIAVDIQHSYINNDPVPAIRQKIHSLVKSYGDATESIEDKRLLGTELRDKFDRLRRFYESMYTEIVSATSQQGW